MLAWSNDDRYFCYLYFDDDYDDDGHGDVEYTVNLRIYLTLPINA